MPGERIPEYVHGYSERERARLLDQASTLTELLHGDDFDALAARACVSDVVE